MSSIGFAISSFFAGKGLSPDKKARGNKEQETDKAKQVDIR